MLAIVPFFGNFFLTVEAKYMFKKAFFLYTFLAISNPLYMAAGLSMAKPSDSSIVEIVENPEVTLSSKSFSLENRNGNKFVNDVFKDNILLTLNYMSGVVKNRSDINWSEVEKPRIYQFTLKPGESFAFHEQILPDQNKNVVKTTNAHFNYQDGFKSDGYLMGDGVCHLASLLYWASKDAGLATYAPTNHDFATINEVPKEYGVSIYNLPGGFEKSARQNLYITNSFNEPVSFIFNYDGVDLRVEITKSKS